MRTPPSTGTPGRGSVLQMEPPPRLKAQPLPSAAPSGVPCPGGPRRSPRHPFPAAAPRSWWSCVAAGAPGGFAGGPDERQLPLLGACPDLLRIPGIAAGLEAGLGVQAPAHTHTHICTHIHNTHWQAPRLPSHLLHVSDLEKGFLHPMDIWQRVPPAPWCPSEWLQGQLHGYRTVTSKGHGGAPPHPRDVSEVLTEKIA